MPFSVVIPARLTSTRLPHKVLREIAGAPMIAHVCRAAIASAAREVIVASDAPEVLAAARAAGAEGVLTRSDHACGTDRIAEVVAQRALADDAVVVNVQADEPLMPSALIDQVADALAHDAQAAMATACTPIADADELGNPNVVKVVANAGGRALYFSRAPIPYDRDSANANVDGALRHLGIYAYRVWALQRFAHAAPGVLERCESLEQLRAYDLDMPITLVRAVALPGPGVDTEEDLRAVARMMQVQ